MQRSNKRIQPLIRLLHIKFPLFFSLHPVSPLNRPTNQRPIGRAHLDRWHINTTMVNYQTPHKNNTIFIKRCIQIYIHSHNTIFDINHTNHNTDTQKHKRYLTLPSLFTGRLSRSALPEETKHPMILPNGSQIATLILHHIHYKVGHGTNHMLSTLRRHFWIPNANPAASHWRMYDLQKTAKQAPQFSYAERNKVAL